MAISYLNDINLNQNELQNAVIQSLGAEPSSGKAGQVYYNNGSINAANKGLWLYNGSQWVRVGTTYDLSAGTVSSNTVPINLVGGDGTTDTVYIAGAGGATITQSNGTITITTSDTKNTAGSTDTSSKIFLIGATSQAANPQTYSHDTAYVGTDGHLYSNSKQVVNLSDSQALTNKTYNGYTLAAASAKGVDTSISSGSTSTNLPTTSAVVSYVGDAIAASDAMIFKGTLGTGGTVTALPTTYQIGWTYRVITAGTYAGQTCEVGDLIIALVDRSGSGNQNSDWTVAQTNIDGAITTADASTATPLVASGSGTAGTSTKYAREGHVHPAQTSVSGNAGTATTLQTARTIDGVSFNGSASIIHYGVCDTNRVTEPKEVSCTGFSLVNGAIITVTFTHGIAVIEGDPYSVLKLNVNSTGAKDVYYKGVPLEYGVQTFYELNWDTGVTHTFVYNATDASSANHHWELVGDLEVRDGAKCVTISNRAITTVNGVATWHAPHNTGNEYPIVSVFGNGPDWVQIMAEVVPYDGNYCDIKILTSESTIGAGRLIATFVG